MSHRIAAAIVVYRPERDLLLPLIRAVAGDVESIVLFLNGNLPADLLDDCRIAAGAEKIRLLGSGANVGLGRAYNEAAQAARQSGCDLLLLFDEDSAPRLGMPARLAAIFDRATGGRRVAVIGPHPIAADSAGGYRLPPSATDTGGLPAELRDLAFVISSGSLIDLAAFAEIGPFREDFFIDGIDIEWCFRARAHGFRNLMALAEPMPHRLGTGIIRIPLLNIPLVDNTPARLFTYARNQAAMMRLDHVPLWWKARIVAALGLRVIASIARGFRGREIGAVLRGVRAGFRRELGPPGDAPGRRPV